MSKNIKTIIKHDEGICKNLGLVEYINENKTYKTTDIDIHNIKEYKIKTRIIKPINRKVYTKTLKIKTTDDEIIEISLFSDIKGVL